jgi:hypothetical protein
VELTGALLNLFARDPGYVPRLIAMKEKLLARSSRPERTLGIRPRQAQVLATVKHVLADADKPLRAKEIQHLCEQLLARPVSLPTVIDCLYRHSNKPDSLFVRVGWGTYSARQSLSAQT